MATQGPNKTVTKTLKIIQINVNSIISLSRRSDLQEFIKKHKPDIVFLSETKLNIKHRVSFTDYNVIRRDRFLANRGGGTAILVKNNLKFSIHNDSRILKFTALETCIINIPLFSNKTFFIISAYYSSNKNSSNFIRELNELFTLLKLDNPNTLYILGGDLNSKHAEWGNSTAYSEGNGLKHWLDDNDLIFRCQSYTSHFPSFTRAASFLLKKKMTLKIA